MQKLINPKFVYRLAWAALVVNVAVILWGSVVRASGSGAGCGDHWPLCGSHLIPTIRVVATLIEFLHRLSTGADVILLIALAVLVYKLFPRRHPARLGVSLTMFFTFTEALLGAVLVIFKLVDRNASLARIIAEAAHLTNTLLLLASAALTVWWTGGGPALRKPKSPALFWLAAGCLLAAVVLCVSGGLAALADTIYPAHGLLDSLHLDFSSSAPLLIHLRVWHPVIATLTVAFLMAAVLQIKRIAPQGSMANVQTYSGMVILLCVMEYCAGFLNLLILAPIWMQVCHLFIADVLWINLIFLVASLLAQQDSTQ